MMEPRERFVRIVARVAGGTAILGLYLYYVLEIYGSIIRAFKEWIK